MIKKVLVTGGSGRFGSALRKIKTKYKIIYPTKKQLDILRIDNIRSFLKRKKPKIVIHMAGLSRPMDQHEKEISRSINLNIIGTSNLVIACSEMKVKIIYISTSYVYPNKGNSFRETDPVLPWNNYGWSKLGAEAAVQMYKNSLIIRACMTEKPFIHKYAFSNVKSNFIFHDAFAKLFLNIIVPEKKIKIKYDLSKPNGTPRKVLDISLAKKYGWKPNYNLKTQILQTYQSYLETEA